MMNGEEEERVVVGGEGGEQRRVEVVMRWLRRGKRVRAIHAQIHTYSHALHKHPQRVSRLVTTTTLWGGATPCKSCARFT